MAKKITTIKIRETNDIEFYLAGGILGGQLTKNGKGAIGVAGLAGLKLKFTSPVAVEVTFAAVAGEQGGFIPLTQITAQLVAAGVPVQAMQRGANGGVGVLGLIEVDPTNGVTIVAASSLDARAALGFDGAAGGTSVGRVVGPPGGAPPTLLNAYMDETNHHVLIISEV